MNDKPDPRFLGGAEGLVMTNMSDMAFALTIDYDGIVDMHAGDGISKQQAAKMLRQVADSLDEGRR